MEASVGAIIGQLDAIATAESIEHLFTMLEEGGMLMRIDKEVTPTTYRCATLSQAELSQLRRIKNIVRLGHLRSIEPTQIKLDHGAVAADPDTLYVDCSASALQTPPSVPVFDGAAINLLMVRTCQPAFSASFIAFVESNFAELAAMNALCTPVPSPEHPLDWLRMWVVSLANGARWSANPEISAWLSRSRLNIMTAYMRGMRPDDTAKKALLGAIGHKAAAAAARLPTLLASAA
jgi:hypothetical protein